MSTWGDFMFCNDYRNAVLRSAKNDIFALAIVWILGFVTGCCFGWNYHSYFVHIIHRDCVVENDFDAQYLTLSSTLLLSFLAIVFRCRSCIYVASFLEGSAYGAILIGLVGCFPVYGWLFAFLFLLPKTLILVVQFVYLQICLRSPISLAFRLLFLVLIIFVPILILDNYLIRPTLFYLLDYL